MSEGDSTEESSRNPGGPGHLDLRAITYLSLMVLIGSSTAPAARYAVRELPVGLVPLFRFGVAGLCLLPFTGKRCQGLFRLLRQDGWRLAAAAALCVPVNQTFFLNAARLTATSHIALIYASVPMVVLLLATASGQEKLRIDRLLGVLASVLGVGLIGLDGLWHGGGSASGATTRGDLLLIGAVLSWGAYLTVGKPLVARHNPLTVLAGTFLVGALLDLPVAWLTLSNGPPLSSASAAAWWGLIYLTLIVTLFALGFQNLALRRLDASQVATFGNAAPLLTVFWGVWLFGETVTPVLAIGGALTLGGILNANRPSRHRHRPGPLPGLAPATSPSAVS